MSDDDRAAALVERVPWSRIGRLSKRAGQSWVVVVAAAVVVGLVVAPVASSVLTAPFTGTVAVVPLAGGIDGASAAETVGMLERARQDPDIDAVVLLANSPGGAASASETLYFAVKRTAREMPVVTSVDALAASGAYYAAVASDRIFVKPSSFVGSVGVIFVRPQPIGPVDRVVVTGPDKLTGADQREWYYKTETLKRAFVNAVVENRGDALAVPRSEVATAEVFTGTRAVENGLADETGGLGDAVRHAARAAGLRSYDVRVLRPPGETQFLTRSAYLASNATDKDLVSPRAFVGAPDESRYPNVLMLPPQVVRAGIQDGADANAGTNRTATGTGAETGSEGGAEAEPETATVTGADGTAIPGPAADSREVNGTDGAATG